MRNFLLLFIILCSCPLLSGCLIAAAGAGAGTVAYVKGEVTKNIPCSLSDSLTISQEVLKNMFGNNVSYNQAKRELTTYRKDGKQVNVVLAPLTENATKVTIRIGTFGDQSQSMEILRRIEMRVRPSSH